MTSLANVTAIATAATPTATAAPVLASFPKAVRRPPWARHQWRLSDIPVHGRPCSGRVPRHIAVDRTVESDAILGVIDASLVKKEIV